MKATAMDKIIEFFSPLVDPEDSLWTLRSRILSVLLNALALFGLAIFLLGMLNHTIPRLTYYLDSSLVPAALLVRVLYRRSRVQTAAIHFFVVGFLVITAVIFDMGSVYAPATSTFLLLIILASVFFGKKGGLSTAVISSLVIYVFVILENTTDLMPDPFEQSQSGLPTAVTFALIFIAIAFIVNWMFERLLQDQANLRALNDELEERVANRTLELQKSRDDLKILNAELLRADKMKDEFLATMSHELRTPLTGILGLTEAIRYKIYGDLSDKQDELLVTVQNSGQHLLSMINDILDLSKIQANRMELEISPFQVSSVCAASAQMVKGMANKKNITVSLEVEPEDLMLLADQKRVKQALVNLLSNAIKFTPNDGKVGLIAKLCTDHQQLSFEVWDTGIGISKEDQERLFKPFVQVDSSLSRQSAGSGLGLFLVRKLTEIQGGGVRMESTPGEGSKFTITLPWKQVDFAGGATNTVDENALPAIEVEKPLRILLVDDHAQSLETLSDELRFIGHTVHAMENAADALHVLASQPVDVIITDIQMPIMDGLAFARQVRALNFNGMDEVPIIALTALAMPGDEKHCMEAGMNKYLTKPITLFELSKTLTQLTK